MIFRKRTKMDHADQFNPFADEDEAMKPRKIGWRCRLGLHPWPKWSHQRQVEYIQRSSESRELDYPCARFVQERNCPCCNAYGRRSVKG